MPKLQSVALLLFTSLACGVALFWPAVAQPDAYHAFADTRTWAGIPNAANTLSNAGFVLVGVAGLVICLGRSSRQLQPGQRLAYAIFFLGMTWTAFGSGYYHLQPDNERLFWDRLPMTVAFMALIAAQLGDRISPRLGLLSLFPLLVLGAASVFYWRATERAGAGNVVPYGVLQAYSVVLILLLGWLKPSRYNHAHAIFQVFGWYVFAKLLEHFDGQVFAVGEVVSGHTLKHLAAAMAGVPLVRMLRTRTLAQST